MYLAWKMTKTDIFSGPTLIVRFSGFVGFRGFGFRVLIHPPSVVTFGIIFNAYYSPKGFSKNITFNYRSKEITALTVNSKPTFPLVPKLWQYEL